MGLGYSFCYGKPQSAAPGFGIAGIIYPNKRLEYIDCKMLRYADAIVTKINQYLMILYRKTYCNQCSPRMYRIALFARF